MLPAAGAMLALLFALLRPACDAFAMPADRHAPGHAHGYVQSIDSATDGHSDKSICCESVDAQALTIPATPPLPAASGYALAAPAGALHESFAPDAGAMRVVARLDPTPLLRYHARSQRRLD